MADPQLGQLFPVPFVPTPQQPGGIGTPVTNPTQTVFEKNGLQMPGCGHSINSWDVSQVSIGGTNAPVTIFDDFTGSAPQLSSSWIRPTVPFAVPDAFIVDPATHFVYPKFGPSLTTGEVMAYRTEFFGNDQSAEFITRQIVFQPPNPPDGFSAMGPAVRVSFDIMTGRMSGYIALTGNDNRLALVVNVNVQLYEQFFIPDPLATRAYLAPILYSVLNPAGGDRIKVQAIGNQISVFLNNVLTIGPITDSRIATGNVGLDGFAPQSTSPTKLSKFNNFTAQYLPNPQVVKLLKCPICGWVAQIISVDTFNQYQGTYSP